MLRAKKSLGQNFLVDASVARRIVEAVNPVETDVVIEIGPGTGALTSRLSFAAGKVVAIEIDRDLVDELRPSLRSDNVSIIVADALTVDWTTLIDEAKNPNGRIKRARIVANLPYYISTPIIEKLLLVGSRLFDMTLMLQKEVADRIVSGPGSKEYGYLSVIVQYFALVTKLFEVPASAFRPAPKVQSAVIRLLLREISPVDIVSESEFFALVRASFAQRRKTILNNLRAAPAILTHGKSVVSALAAASIDARRRAETISLDEFAALHRAFSGNLD